MPEISAIHAALGRIVDPCSIATGVPISLASMGMVKSVTELAGAVHITLTLTSPICWQASNILASIEATVGALPGVASVTCSLVPGEWMPDMMAPEARERLRRLRPIPKGR
jgi:metal-sulfur cluster biosynthetic enzyme